MAAPMRRGLVQFFGKNLHDLTSFHSFSRLSIYKSQSVRCCTTSTVAQLEENDGGVDVNQKSYLMQAAEDRRIKYGKSIWTAEDWQTKYDQSNLLQEGKDRKINCETLMKTEREAYERGKRHLANMMGEDPTTFTQEDIDRALAYLLPSGLFEKKARPTMKSPEESYPPIQAAQYGPDGRPEHFLFYTKNPQYFELMHNTFQELEKLIIYEKRKLAAGILEPDEEELNFSNSEWINKLELQTRIIENISDEQFQRFVALLERMCLQPYAKQAQDYIGQFRNEIRAIAKKVTEPVQYDETGRAYTVTQGVKKSARAEVLLRDQGSGKVTVNGSQFLVYFPELQNRLQILFPFDFIGMVNRFDVEATVTGGGQSSQATAIRHGISVALSNCFVDPHKAEQMRQAGLLTRDPRRKERKKPGQKGARAKFTWKKR